MRLRPARLVLNVFLTVVALGWLAPLALAVYASIRPYEETSRKGYFSWPDRLTLHYYAQVWDSAELPKYFTNSVIVAIPGVILTLFLASFVAFCIARLRIRFALPLLVVFTAGNLLPPQVLVTPLYEMYKQIPVPGFVSDSGTLYDSYAGLIAIHVAFQVGFCVFVLSNFMRTLPVEITEAAVMDGAGVWLQYWKVTLPLCRPALAALATLLFTWIYNDFLYALVLISTGDKLPVTSALNNLRGQFFTDYNLLAAGSLLVALPTLVVFFALQRQFVAGLTLGAAKG
ncbi:MULTISPECIES: carbohydrate ABC transporter permease [Dactylosporangium]|uniref:ABC transporter permease n=2 Tax=Dactylosporangium TaxID=35753 RepID=A0A9W6KMA6_9ACTN|nr:MULTISPECIES: carbohydrate ABC transporter permease [Dactylosporangium]UAB95227.1 carbohydrate ABC transporter permease [Dactylosporangium vinaceum]UWZ43554.1 carbohydrate ABC transporter permease [Dactylosporangium matsuzakiense]GLL04118.1 ABC transporter permease [Dactylosporangium matsuzakiense]